MESWKVNILNEVSHKLNGTLFEMTTSEKRNKVALLGEKIKGINSPTLKKKFEDLVEKYKRNIDVILEYLNTFDSALEVEGLRAIKSNPPQYREIWGEIMNLQAKPEGPGELYIYLTTKDTEFSKGDRIQSYDLSINNERWEVKKIPTSGTFQLGKKGLMSRHESFRDLYDTIKIMEYVHEEIMKDDEVSMEIKTLSETLYEIIVSFHDELGTGDSISQALKSGNLSGAALKFLKTLKSSVDEALTKVDELEKEYTSGVLKGKAIQNFSRKIVPIKPGSEYWDEETNTVMINFLEDETLSVLERLTQLPEFQKNKNIEKDLEDVSSEIKSSLDNLFFVSSDNIRIIKIPQDEVINAISRGNISKGGMNLKVNRQTLQANGLVN